MESNKLEPTKGNSELPVNNSKNPNGLQWAEFVLNAGVICWLLALMSIVTVFVLAVVGYMVWHRMDAYAVGIGALITGTVGWLGKLVYNAIKARLGPKK